VRFTVITLFPDFFAGALQHGLLGKGIEQSLVEVRLTDLRRFGEGRHLTTDDAPYGGGSGMVMKPGPVVAAIEAVRGEDPGVRVVLLTPQGRAFGQPVAREFAQRGSVAFVCGRYEGFDERIRAFADEEVSLGDFVLMGGEVAALAMIEATARLIPGVLGDLDSTVEESHAEGFLEYPQYTRPREFRGLGVPEVLLGGNHAEVARWRHFEALRRTALKRPDLLADAALTEEELRFVRNVAAEGETK
jgi:tRNA (guanine37-N1)-methyltransferase